MFLAILLAGVIATRARSAGQDISHWDLAEASILGAGGAVLLGLLLERLGRPLWHAIANARAEKLHLVVLKPWVIDGDTIDDLACGVRYRLANIDAPEMGDGAKCAHERQRAQLAQYAAIAMVRRAKVVTVRRTFRTDIYGRRIAFVYADGVDIGEALVAKGFARPWRGRRERWCGPRGGLAKIGETRAMPISCSACGAWSRF